MRATRSNLLGPRPLAEHTSLARFRGVTTEGQGTRLGFLAARSQPTAKSHSVLKHQPMHCRLATTTSQHAGNRLIRSEELRALRLASPDRLRSLLGKRLS